MDTNIAAFFHSPIAWSTILAWLTASTGKLICHLVVTRRFRLRFLLSTGGMPSAHSAAVSGLATSVGLLHGWSSPVFMVACVLAFLTMFDASTVRRAAGNQARILNEILDELFQEQRLKPGKLKELLGHTRLEVAAGMVIGILIALIICSCAAS
ncbi:MAG: divergent PAP2 family protein [Lentisphaerales bacterium]|jgi:acid phosphatase family membrane protein YuiD|nr:MAG: divergent PAP2 family protein [Lentisphaerales bacterium]